MNLNNLSKSMLSFLAKI